MDFDWKIWAAKWAKGLGVTLAGAACIYTANYIEITEFPPEYAFWGGLTVIVLQQIGNWFKHAYMVEDD